MERIDDIYELLDAVDDNLVVLKAAYEKARFDEEQKNVVRPLIKSMLSDLRSVLDYSAQTIWESYTTKKTRPHFPYGKDEAKFRSSIKTNLDGLERQKPGAFVEVQSIQPHKCGSNWLHVLCSMTNMTKHNNLGKQNRENSKAVRTKIGGLAEISGGRIFFENSVLNGVLVGDKGVPLELSNERTLKQMQEGLRVPMEMEREFEWVKFKFDDHVVDALELLTKSSTEIRLYIERLLLVV